MKLEMGDSSEIGRTCLENQGLTGGGRGIRTPERLPTLTVFKTAAFNHSAIPPISKYLIPQGFINTAATDRARLFATVTICQYPFRYAHTGVIYTV
jgi:hypothetical protein